MAKVKLIIDSTADLTEDEIKKYDFEVVNLTVNIDGEEFESIDNTEYIKKMTTAKSFSTSQPAVGKFYEIYQKWTDKGYTIISFHMSDAISGTVNTATSVANEFKDVHVINTKTTSRAMLYFVEDFLKYISEGMDLKEAVELVRNKTDKVLTYVTIDKLDNLVKGGRLKRSAGLIGGLLNIKVLTKLENEELITVDKVRGKKKLVQLLIATLKKDIGDCKIKRISLAHSLATEYLSLIKEAVKQEFSIDIEDKDITITSPIISTHTGEGAVGLLIELA